MWNSHSPYYTGLVAVGFPESLGKPLQTLIQTVTGGGAGGLDELGKGRSVSNMISLEKRGLQKTWNEETDTHPSTAGQALEAELLGDLGGGHSILTNT